jgi:hypothetical protein
MTKARSALLCSIFRDYHPIVYWRRGDGPPRLGPPEGKESIFLSKVVLTVSSVWTRGSSDMIPIPVDASLNLSVALRSSSVSSLRATCCENL